MNSILKFKTIVVLIILISITSAYSQCNDQLMVMASEKLKNFNYVKDFKVKMKKGKMDGPVPSQRATVILNSGSRYKIFTVSAKDYDGKLIADFFSQEGLMASTYGQDSRKHYEAIEFECKKTGIYYISLYFEGAKEGCGICILSVENEEAKRDRLTTFK